MSRQQQFPSKYQENSVYLVYSDQKFTVFAVEVEGYRKGDRMFSHPIARFDEVMKELEVNNFVVY